LSVSPLTYSYAASEGRYAPYFKPGFVHRDLYVSEAIFREELKTLFASTWVYVAHESEIPLPGDYVTRVIGRRPVIVVRDEAGGINVLLNRCTHRGATICREERGNATLFTCPYHAWSFTRRGACAAVPVRSGYGESVNLAAFNLGKAASVDSYRGFIFATLTPTQPLIQHLAGAATMLDQWLDRNAGIKLRVRNGAMAFKLRTNWKCVYDNAADGYHVPFSHASMIRVIERRYGKGIDINYDSGVADASPLFVKNLGNGHTILDQRPEMHASSAWKRQHVLPGREILWSQLNDQLGEDSALALLNGSTGAGMNINIFPNLLIIGNQIQVIEPQSVNESVIRWYSTSLESVPPEINAIRMRMQEDFPSFGEVDDAANFEACQLGLEEIPEMEWVNVSRHMDTQQSQLDQDGYWREPISTDLHARAYWSAWRKLMESARTEDPGR
jgi:nitrite reductase/ring-hydroxylating ferredoxin subunit